MKSAIQFVQLPDFDTLVSLHENDPEAFEYFRKHLLREAISQSPKEYQATLEALLSKMEIVRENGATPLEAALGAARLMRSSLRDLQSAWKDARVAAVDLQAGITISRNCDTHHNFSDPT